MTRRKFTSKFKAKVVIEALKERAETLAVLALQIPNRKKEFLQGLMCPQLFRQFFPVSYF